MNWPVIKIMTWTAKTIFLANEKNEDFNYKNRKLHFEKFYGFELFVDFSTDSNSPAFKNFRNGFRLQVHVKYYPSDLQSFLRPW